MPDSSPSAFVTGGTGFIGSHLVEALLARGYRDVRCLVRSDLKWLDDLPITPIYGDLSDVEALWSGLENIDFVYHIAGLTRAPTYEALEQANVSGTLNLLGTIRHAAPSIRKVLITSSLAAVGHCDARVATEDSPLRPISGYGKSKAAMEHALTVPVQDGTVYMETLPVTIVRPPAVYGPREADIFTFFQTVSKGLCPIVGRGTAPALSLVHGRDLAHGMIDAAESDAATGEVYFIGSERAYSWNEVRDATLQALNRRALTIAVPPALVGVIGAASEWFGKLTGTYPPLNREKAREIREACTICSVAKARRDFGYRQQIPLDEGIRETIAWYREHGWL